LSNSFENNRGRLPYPVDKGFVSLGFGTYTHPTETHVKLENYGVDISTNPGTAARAVFDGKVSSAFFTAGIGWVVIVNHGQYFTVYRGLSNVNVKKDDNLRTKQSIGTVGQNDDGATVLNFQIWKVGSNNKSSKLNPAQWLAK
jgi:murein DD-endopeptidase MepM/ murein hydrolase activator NlpD